MTTPADRLLTPLLEALLAARTQPGAEAFDQAVAAAVAAGTLPADLARELRYWQRASVHEVTDYVRTVLPAVLPGTLAAVTGAADDAASATGSAADLWSSRDDLPPAQPVDHPPADVPAEAEAVLSAPDVIVLPADTGDPVDPVQSLVDPVDAGVPDEADEDRSRQHARRRLFVAGLTSTA